MAYDRYTDFIGAVGLFCKDIEYFKGQVTPDHLSERVALMCEELNSHEHALIEFDAEEAVKAAAHLTFFALTQVYHVFRSYGYEHEAAVSRMRGIMLDISDNNLSKEPPKAIGMKAIKGKKWKPVDIAKYFTKYERQKDEAGFIATKRTQG